MCYWRAEGPFIFDGMGGGGGGKAAGGIWGSVISKLHDPPNSTQMTPSPQKECFLWDDLSPFSEKSYT